MFVILRRMKNKNSASRHLKQLLDMNTTQFKREYGIDPVGLWIEYRQQKWVKDIKNLPIERIDILIIVHGRVYVETLPAHIIDSNTAAVREEYYESLF